MVPSNPRRLQPGDIRKWLAQSKSGDAAIYHVGNLAIDRGANPTLSRAAGALYKLSTTNALIAKVNYRYIQKVQDGGTADLLLLQRKARDGTGCEYIVVVRRSPLPDDISRAFGFI